MRYCKKTKNERFLSRFLNHSLRKFQVNKIAKNNVKLHNNKQSRDCDTTAHSIF